MANKTEAVLVAADRKAIEHMRNQVGDQTIDSKEAVKYLGVMLNSRLQFSNRIQTTLARRLHKYRQPYPGFY